MGVLLACESSGSSSGATDMEGGEGPTQGDMDIPLPAAAPTCDFRDGNITVRVDGVLAGTTIAVDWQSATGSISHGSAPGPVSTRYSIGPYPRYDYPDAGLELRWEGTSDFEGSLPASGSLSPREEEGGPIDVGNCEDTSRVWRIDDRSYVFELRTLSLAVGEEYCGGEARPGTLVGCILDDHGF